MAPSGPRPSYDSILHQLFPSLAPDNQSSSQPLTASAAKFFFDLPPEIHHSILALLDFDDLRSLCRTSKAFLLAARPFLFRNIEGKKYYRFVEKLRMLADHAAPDWTADALAQVRSLSVTTKCPNSALGGHQPSVEGQAPDSVQRSKYDLGFVMQGDESEYIGDRLQHELAKFLAKAPGVRSFSWEHCKLPSDMSTLLHAFDSCSLTELTLSQMCQGGRPADSSDVKGAPLMEEMRWTTFNFATHLTVLDLHGFTFTQSSPHVNVPALDELLVRATSLVSLRLIFDSPRQHEIAWVLLSRMDSYHFPALRRLETEHCAAPSAEALERFLARHSRIEMLCYLGAAWADLDDSELPAGIVTPPGPILGTFSPSKGASIHMPSLRCIITSSQRLLAAVLSASSPLLIEGAAVSLDASKPTAISDPPERRLARAYALDGNATDALSLCNSILELNLTIHGDNHLADWAAKLDTVLQKIPSSVVFLALRFPSISAHRGGRTAKYPLRINFASLSHLVRLRVLSAPHELLYTKTLVDWRAEGACQHERLAAVEEQCVKVTSELARRLPALDQVVYMGCLYLDEHGLPQEVMSWNHDKLTFGPNGWFVATVTRLNGPPPEPTAEEKECMKVDDDMGRSIYLVTSLAAARHHELVVAEEAKRSKPAVRETTSSKKPAPTPSRVMPSRKAKVKVAEVEQGPAPKRQKVTTAPTFRIDVVQRSCCCRACYWQENVAELPRHCRNAATVCCTSCDGDGDEFCDCGCHSPY